MKYQYQKQIIMSLLGVGVVGAVIYGLIRITLKTEPFTETSRDLENKKGESWTFGQVYQ
jgi:hypothetical protein